MAGKPGARFTQAPAALLAMRWVSKQPKSKDTTELHRMYRSVMVKEPAKFLDRLQKAEADWMLAKAKSVGEKADRGPVVADAGVGACVGMLEQWLQEHNSKEKRHERANEGGRSLGGGNGGGDCVGEGVAVGVSIVDGI